MLSYRKRETKEELPASAFLFEMLTSYQDPWMDRGMKEKF
jgi:hypothetical protein